MALKLKITDKLAGSLQWNGKEYLIWDADLEGFGVRVWGDGPRKAYIVQAKRDGRQFREVLGKVGEITTAKARIDAIAFRGAVKDGRDPRAEEKTARGAWMLTDAMDHFRGTHAAVRRLSEGYRADADAMFRHQTPDRWKVMKLTDISQAMVAARHREITGGATSKDSMARGGSRRANYWLSIMSKLFELGITQGHCTSNSAKGIRRNDEVQRERFLSPRELSALWTYLERHSNVEAAVCVQFILLTGCRPGEAFTMRWADLDKSTRIWRKPAARTKQRKQHTVRLTDRAMAILNRLDTHKRSLYVFPSPEDATKPRHDKLKSFWRVVRKHCALPDVRLYDCRHSFASWLAMGGATELEIAAQLGHSNTQTTRRYVHIAQDHLLTKAGIMGEVIAKALADHPPDQQALVGEKRADGSVTVELQSVSGDDLDQPH